MTVLPVGRATGKIEGRFVVGVTDGADPDQDPDVIPVSGTALFKSSIAYIPVVGDPGGPVTWILGRVAAIFDEEGYLATPYPKGHPREGEVMYRGVFLHATDDTGGLVTDWTWTVEINLDKVDGFEMKFPSSNFAVPTGSVQDLTTLVKVPSSPGWGLPQSEAAALRSAESSAESAASAEESKQAALVAQQISDGVRADAAAGVFDGLSAYEVWLGLGHTGTEADFMNWLKGPQGDPGNATLRVDSTVGERVYVSAGATEKLLSATTFMRDVASLLTANVAIETDGYARMIRENNRVTLLLKNVGFLGSATSNYFLAAYPIGFRPSGTSGRIPVYMNSSGSTNISGVTVRYSERDMSIINRTATPKFGDQFSITQISWLTNDAWPTAAALAALPVVP
ncbi:hypothetical protein [Glutamicibacter sp.]|uniref:hypothetical protein n=1 Tax=Glutamicibacter sp. TaxID=1931995 RepID=UPI0028BD57CA|nr:hypothetical protein [Glutamicibacter sp.]